MLGKDIQMIYPHSMENYFTTSVSVCQWILQVFPGKSPRIFYFWFPAASSAGKIRAASTVGTLTDSFLYTKMPQIFKICGIPINTKYLFKQITTIDI